MFVNPNSGAGKSLSVFHSHVAKKLEASGIDYELVVTSKLADLFVSYLLNHLWLDRLNSAVMGNFEMNTTLNDYKVESGKPWKYGRFRSLIDQDRFWTNSISADPYAA